MKTNNYIVIFGCVSRGNPALVVNNGKIIDYSVSVSILKEKYSANLVLNQSNDEKFENYLIK